MKQRDFDVCTELEHWYNLFPSSMLTFVRKFNILTTFEADQS